MSRAHESYTPDMGRRHAGGGGAGGYAGQALIVDVSGPDVRTLPLDERVLRAIHAGTYDFCHAAIDLQESIPLFAGGNFVLYGRD